MDMALLSSPTFRVLSNRAVVDSRRCDRQITSLCIGQHCLILTCSSPGKRKSSGNVRWRYRLRQVVVSSGDDSGSGSLSFSSDGDDLSLDSIENEKDQLFDKLSRVGAKQEEFVSAIIREKDFVESELEAVQSLYDQKLQESLAEKSALELKLARAKQEAFELAIQVEKMTELAYKQTTSHVLEDAQRRVSAAETSTADMAFQIEEQVRTATESVIASIVDQSKDVIQKALDASEKVGGQTTKALAICNQVIDPVDEVISLQSENIKLEVAVSDLESKLLLSKNEVDKLQLELEEAHAQANVAKLRAQDIEKTLLEFQESNKRTSLENEGETKSLIEKIRKDVEDKNKHIVDAFNIELESIKVIIEAVNQTTLSRDNAFMNRCEALKRSLMASEYALKTWKQRAKFAESLLFKDKTKIKDDDAIYFSNSGRIDLLTDDQSHKWKLLSDGPRKETPQWLATRIANIRPKFPPRKIDLLEAFEQTFRLLELPKPDEVWSIAQEKPRDGDVLIDHVIKKEILEKKKKALERIIDKTTSRWKKTPEEIKIEPGTGTGREIVFQAFNWESWRKQWYLDLTPKAADLSQTGITAVWFPPPTESVAPQGYMPSDLYNLNSAYGSVDELKNCIEHMHAHNLQALGDVVLNHRCAHKQSPNGVWNIFGGKLAWGPEAIVCDDPHFQGRGNPSSGDFFHAAPNIDHSQDFVRRDIKEWLNWLKSEIGFDGWRLDFVRGFSGAYVREYIETSNPAFAIGEYWDSLAYDNGNLCYNQDDHRQRLVDWINATGGTSSAFDVTTKGILHYALHNQYWRLIDPQGKPTGVMGWWPSRAVTFLENHDTGSTQGHWPFPRDKLGQGYAYVLTHPGTPAIFYDHFYDFSMHDMITELVEARKRAGIHCRSAVKIFHANNEGYVAKVDETLVMKLGHFHWNPSKENQLDGSWQMFVDKGGDYQIWLRV